MQFRGGCVKVRGEENDPIIDVNLQ
jgi:hypothetical protein